MKKLLLTTAALAAAGSIATAEVIELEAGTPMYDIVSQQAQSDCLFSSYHMVEGIAVDLAAGNLHAQCSDGTDSGEFIFPIPAGNLNDLIALQTMYDAQAAAAAEEAADNTHAYVEDAENGNYFDTTITKARFNEFRAKIVELMNATSKSWAEVRDEYMDAASVTTVENSIHSMSESDFDELIANMDEAIEAAQEAANAGPGPMPSALTDFISNLAGYGDVRADVTTDDDWANATIVMGPFLDGGYTTYYWEGDKGEGHVVYDNDAVEDKSDNSEFTKGANRQEREDFNDLGTDTCWLYPNDCQ